MDISDIKISAETIKFNNAVKYNNGYYINIYDNSFENIIIQTPKLKICYSCVPSKNSGIKNRSYYYSVLLNDELTTFIQEFEELSIIHLKKIKSSLGISKFTFNSCIHINETTENAAMKIKLITDKDANILTLINMNTREVIDFSNIKTDYQSIQFIEFSGLSITNDGSVYPILVAHQIVIFPIYKIYKKKLLIDILALKDDNGITEVRSDLGIPNRKSKQHPPQQQNNGKTVFKLDPNMLQNMKAKLKNI